MCQTTASQLARLVRGGGEYRGKERGRKRETERQREGTTEREIERENKEWGHLSLLLIGYQATHSLHPVW